MSTVTEVRTRNPWLVLAVICVGHLVALLDTTVVNVAIPSMIEGLDASLQQILWITNAYLLVYAVLLVTGGRCGDIFGPKRLYLIGLTVFTIASVACGLANDVTQVIIARVFQGAGAAMLTPQSLAIVSRIFPPERRGAALGVWGAAAGIAAAAGPTLGGLIISSLGWRWVFYINLPIGVTAIVLSVFLLPPLTGTRRSRLDLVGTALVTLGLLPIVYGLLQGPASNWGVMVAGLAVLVVFVLFERGRQGRDPLLPFAIFKARNFALASGVIGALPAGLGAMLLLTLMYLQSVTGLSALAAGLVVAIAPLISVFVAPYSGRWTDRWGGKYVLIAGFLLFGVGLGALSVAMSPGASWVALLPGLAVFGVGMGVAFSPGTALAMHDVDSSLAGAASGVFNMSRLSGSVLGGSAVGALLQARIAVEDLGSAIRTTYWLPVGIVVVAALATLGVKHR